MEVDTTSTIRQTSVNAETGTNVEYRFLYQFVSDMDQQNIRETANQLTSLASKQLKAYNKQGLVERTTMNKNPQMPLHDLFVGIPRYQKTLSKD